MTARPWHVLAQHVSSTSTVRFPQTRTLKPETVNEAIVAPCLRESRSSARITVLSCVPEFRCAIHRCTSQQHHRCAIDVTSVAVTYGARSFFFFATRRHYPVLISSPAFPAALPFSTKLFSEKDTYPEEGEQEVGIGRLISRLSDVNSSSSCVTDNLARE